MCSGNVPFTQQRCSVLVITKPDNFRYLFLYFSPIQREFCVSILHEATRRVVDRIASKNEKVFDPPVVNVSCELRKLDCPRITRNLANNQRLTKIFEGRIDRIRE